MEVGLSFLGRLLLYQMGCSCCQVLINCLFSTNVLDYFLSRLLSSLCGYIIEPTLAFVSNSLPSSVRESSGCDVHEVTSFTKFLTALFDSHLIGKRQRDHILGLSDDCLAAVIAGLFSVAYVWAFGSILQHESVEIKLQHQFDVL